MDTKTFLSRVSAPLDKLVLCLWKADPKEPNGIFWNVGAYDDLDAAAAAAAKWDASQEWTVYFSVGRMANNEYTKDNGRTGYRRTQEHATWFKSICFDLDIGGKYATQREGHAAVLDATRKIGMPAPMVVNSGRGIHYYWPLQEAIRKHQWELLSKALRLALADHQVEIDTSKIHDPSMVLRPVGTHHKKQTPWRDVALMADAPDYDVLELAHKLKPWFGMAKALQTGAAKKPAARNSIMAAILNNANLNLDILVKKCKQLAALEASGGATDAAGSPVEEPMWRAALGIAKFTPDPQTSIIRLAGKHPEFDLNQNLDKMSRWVGKPTLCSTFEQHCPGGCAGCAYKGVVSPASINEEPVAPLPAAVTPTQQDTPVQLPEGYLISNGKVWQEIEVDVEQTDATGAKVKTKKKHKELVSPYELHVTATYADLVMSATTVHIAVKYPIPMGVDQWVVHEVPMNALSTYGQEFQQFLGNKQIFIASEDTKRRLRTYIMRYLELVQQQMPTGREFGSFGWQPDGSFLCGEHLINSPSNNNLRRLSGAATSYSKVLSTSGSREEWANLTKLVDTPGADILGINLLVAATGALGNVSGAGTLIMSTYSPETGTGKTLSLMLGNSLAGEPISLMISPKSTGNAIYKILGTLGDISASIDEITGVEVNDAVDLAYNVSMGKEKSALTRERDLRVAETWSAPTRVTCNISMYSKYEASMESCEAVKMRTLEFIHGDKTFVNVHGVDMYNGVTTHYGHALPELVEGLVAAGGRRAVWDAAVEAFDRKFGFTFESQERFFRAAIIGSYAMGVLGQRLDLFRFDVERVIRTMLARVVELRKQAVDSKADGFDVVGQYLQEFNHQVVVWKEPPAGSMGKGQAMLPVPDTAVVRLEIVGDDKYPVLPGSKIILNCSALGKWLMKRKDSLDRLTAELDAQGAVIKRRERVTMYKGCHKSNPGQAHCLILNAMHPRFAASFTNAKSVASTAPALAVLQS